MTSLHRFTVLSDISIVDENNPYKRFEYTSILNSIKNAHYIKISSNVASNYILETLSSLFKAAI